MYRTLTRFALLLALPALLVLAGCDRHDHDDDHLEEIQRVEVRDSATNTLYAFWVDGQNDDQFQGDGVPPIPVGQEIALDVLFIDEGGRLVALSESGEYRLGIRLANQQQDGVVGQEGIVDFSVHGDHADLEGLAIGETHLVFQLMHGGHSDFDSPPLHIVVANFD